VSTIIPTIILCQSPYYEIFSYTPEPGFLGKDSALYMAEFEGKLYKIQMNILVTKGFSDEMHTESPCPPDEMIKIEESKSEIPAFDWSSVSIVFGDLPDGVLAQTLNGTITLDNNAAGHGWFIDNTP
jgi:hypothetical protein